MEADRRADDKLSNRVRDRDAQLRALAIRRHGLVMANEGQAFTFNPKLKRTPRLATLSRGDNSVVDLLAFSVRGVGEGLIRVHQPVVDNETIFPSRFPFGNTTPIRYSVELRDLTRRQAKRLSVELHVATKFYDGSTILLSEKDSTDVTVEEWRLEGGRYSWPHFPVRPELSKGVVPAIKAFFGVYLNP